MEIVTFVLIVTATVTIALTALASRALGVWPLQKRVVDPAQNEQDERRAKWRAQIVCAALAAYSLGLCLVIEDYNRRCGNTLPAPYHPRGWRRASHVSQVFYRVQHGIPEDRVLTAAEAEQVRLAREQADNMNTLHDHVEASVKVHVFVPLAFVWLGALLLGRRTPLLARVGAVPLLGCLVVSAYLMTTRQYFVALMGD